MCNLKLFLWVAFVGYVAGSHVSKIISCYRRDLHCVSNLVNQIIHGFPEYGIESMDTVVIPEMKIEDCGLTLKNINVRGLTNQNIDEFKVYGDRRTLKLSFGAQVQIHADAILESKFPVHNPWYPIIANVYHGKYDATANTQGYSLYPIDIKHSNGNEHYDLGSEVTVSEVVGKPEASIRFNHELRIDTHSLDASCHGDQLHSLLISKIVSKAYGSFFKNARAIAAIFPRSTFFHDL